MQFEMKRTANILNTFEPFGKLTIDKATMKVNSAYMEEDMWQ